MRVKKMINRFTAVAGVLAAFLIPISAGYETAAGTVYTGDTDRYYIWDNDTVRNGDYSKLYRKASFRFDFETDGVQKTHIEERRVLPTGAESIWWGTPQIGHCDNCKAQAEAEGLYSSRIFLEDDSGHEYVSRSGLTLTQADLAASGIDFENLSGPVRVGLEILQKPGSICTSCGRHVGDVMTVEGLFMSRTLICYNSQPRSVEVESGGSAVFSVDLSRYIDTAGRPRDYFKWCMKAGDEWIELSDGYGPFGEVYSGTDTYKMAVGSINYNMQGIEYCCKLYGAWGGTVYSGTATVSLPEAAAGPTPEPTAEPTPEPTAEPTPKPTAEPTPEPTAEPTPEPTAEPETEPTAKPTREPTAAPTREPTAAPTREPTSVPTREPTAAPTREPTMSPTRTPTAKPTRKPTAVPTQIPTLMPTAEPTSDPTAVPTAVPADATDIIVIPLPVTVTPTPAVTPNVIIPGGGGQTSYDPVSSSSSYISRDSSSTSVTATDRLISSSTEKSSNGDDSTHQGRVSAGGAITPDPGITAQDTSDQLPGKKGSSAARPGGTGKGSTGAGGTSGRNPSGSSSGVKKPGSSYIMKDGILYIVDDESEGVGAGDGIEKDKDESVENIEKEQEYSASDLAVDGQLRSQDLKEGFFDTVWGQVTIIGSAVILFLAALFFLFFGVIVFGEVEEHDEVFELCAVRLMLRKNGNWSVRLGSAFDDNAVLKLRIGILFAVIFEDWELTGEVTGMYEGETTGQVQQGMLLYRKNIRRSV